MKPPNDILAFMQRWRRKSASYNLDTLYGCFDGFFSAFVLYNFLYDYICQEDETRFPETRDRERSVNVVPRFLGVNAVSTDSEIRTAAQQLKLLVEEKAFYLRDEKWDAEQVAGLGSSNGEQWAKSLLEIVYRIRCNTFHGRKPFRKEQRLVLVPCIVILRRVNDLLMERLAPGMLAKFDRTGASDPTISE